jgi:hypothetical protein
MSTLTLALGRFVADLSLRQIPSEGCKRPCNQNAETIGDARPCNIDAAASQRLAPDHCALAVSPFNDRLCVFPKVAQWNGVNPSTDAANWSCVNGVVNDTTQAADAVLPDQGSQNQAG